MIAERLRSIERTISRAAPAPLLVRCAVFLTALVGFVLAYPVEILSGRVLGLLALAALLPAVRPRRFWPTLAILVTVAGWLLSTSGFDRPITLWRLLGLATVLYLTHNLCGLAALLPYDAVVAPEVLARWLSRALAVVLAAAVLGVVLIAMSGRGGGRTFLAAGLGGLAVAVGAAALLAWLSRRRTRGTAEVPEEPGR